MISTNKTIFLGPAIFEVIQNMQKDQAMLNNIAIELRAMGIEQLEYIKRIQNEGTVRMSLMEEAKAKEILAEREITLPISNLEQFKAVNSLLKEETIFKEALVSNHVYFSDFIDYLPTYFRNVFSIKKKEKKNLYEKTFPLYEIHCCSMIRSRLVSCILQMC